MIYFGDKYVLRVYRAAALRKQFAALPTLIVTTAPTLAGIKSPIVAGDTHTAILSGLTQAGETTPLQNTVTPTLLTTDSDPATGGGVYTGVQFAYAKPGFSGAFETVLFAEPIIVPNTAPVAVDDTGFTTLFETAIQISVLGNDSDFDGDPLTITAASSASGTVTISGDNTLVFTPANGFEGTASISYTISDGEGGTDTATASVLVGNDLRLTPGTMTFTDVQALTDAAMDVEWTVNLTTNGNPILVDNGPVVLTPIGGSTTEFTVTSNGSGTSLGTVTISTVESVVVAPPDAQTLELITPLPFQQSGAIAAGVAFQTTATFTSPHTNPKEMLGFMFFEYPGTRPTIFGFDYGPELVSPVIERSFSGVGVWAVKGAVTGNNQTLAVVPFSHPMDNVSLTAFTSSELEYVSNVTSFTNSGSPTFNLNVPEQGGVIVAVIGKQAGANTIEFTAGVTEIARTVRANGTICILGIATGLTANAAYPVTVTRTGSFSMNIVAFALRQRV